MTPQQVVATVHLIISEYWMLRPEEIMLAFKNGVLGKYANMPYRIDTNSVLLLIKNYVENDRWEAIEKKQNKLRKTTDHRQQDFADFYNAEREFLLQNGKPRIVIESEKKKEKAQQEHKKENDYQAEYIRVKSRKQSLV